MVTMEALVQKLAGIQLSALLHGRIEADIYGSTLENDMRKQARVIRELVEAGYLAGPFTNKTRGDMYYQATKKVYDSIDATKPDLISLAFRYVEGSKKVHPYDLEKCQGARWSDLRLGEQKWIVEHPNDYQVFTWNMHWAPSVAKHHKVGVASAWENRTYSYDDTIYVSDASVVAERQRRIRDAHADDIRTRNLAWGLSELEFISEDEAREVKHADESGPFGDRGAVFSNDPLKWGEDIHKVIHSLRQKLATDLLRLNLFEKIEAKVREAGGWEKFLERYEEKVQEATDEVMKRKEENKDG